MSYDEIQSSWQGGSEVWLVEVTLGESGRKIRVTNHDVKVTHDGETYTPIPIEIGNMSSEEKTSDSKVDITVPAFGNEIAELFYPNLSYDLVDIKILHASLSDQEQTSIEGTILAFVGRATGAKKAGDEVVVECRPRSAETDKYGLNLLFSRECGLQLYGRRCEAARDWSMTTARVSLLSDGSFRIVVDRRVDTLYSAVPDRAFRPLGISDFYAAELWTFDSPKKFRIVPGGFFFDTEMYRLDNSMTQFDEEELRDIVLAHRDRSDQAIDAYVTLNCSRSIVDCHLIHRNATRFWGFPNVPTENPTNGSLENFKGNR